MKVVLLLLILFSLQQPDFWNMLADVTYETRKQDGYDIDFPIFGDEAKSLNGKTIALKGYMVPLENLLGSQYFMLSSLPFNNCFFCGGAGPETIVEVFTADKVTFTSDIIIVEGKLELNDTDPDHHMYMFKNAKIK